MCCVCFIVLWQISEEARIASFCVSRPRFVQVWRFLYELHVQRSEKDKILLSGHVVLLPQQSSAWRGVWTYLPGIYFFTCSHEWWWPQSSEYAKGRFYAGSAKINPMKCGRVNMHSSVLLITYSHARHLITFSLFLVLLVFPLSLMLCVLMVLL